MAFCAKCGASLAEGTEFCSHCGTPVGQTSTGGAFPPPPMQYAPPSAGPVSPPALATRVTNILTRPKEEWPVIERETNTVAALYSGYIAVLLAIPAAAMFFGYSLVGINFGFGTIRIPMIPALTGAILQYVLSLAGVYLSAFVIDKLAPNFQSQPSFNQALKLVAYASTASWVSGVFLLLPALGFVTLLAGLYGIYLFYLGLPVMMKVPQDKVITYLIVSAVIIVVIYVVIGVIVGVVVRPTYSLGGITG